MSTIQHKLEQQRAEKNKRLTCQCGSTHFYLVRVEEWRDMNYGSTTFSPLSQSSEQFLVCICGIPYLPSDAGQPKDIGTAKGRFASSVAFAAEFRKKSTPQGLAKAFVSLEEYNAVKQQLEDLQGRIDWAEGAIETLNSAEEVEETTELPETVTEPAAIPAKSASKKAANR